ncbi:hypothetical protein PAL_GLEAN10012651 [Pteropus alecto]|uniref:Uncharacterized protein n=1 Tax=Pteropus alecto TaxID=9402 RepID=L5K7L8_PTEAL|nr:hypothetical protein PAL_GLEAN10012651 [Pteropus alecto]
MAPAARVDLAGVTGYLREVGAPQAKLAHWPAGSWVVSMPEPGGGESSGLARTWQRKSDSIQGKCAPGKTQGSETARPPKKKRKRPQKKSCEREEKAAEPRAQSLAASRAGKPAAAKDEEASGSTGGPTGVELWDAGQGRRGSMQTWSSLVVRKDTARHGGIMGDVPKSELQGADHRGAVGGWDPRKCTAVPGRVVNRIWQGARQ